jgi:DNA primase
LSGIIPEDVINRVRDGVDIVELVSRYISLKKAGSSFKALCPFHKEKTPSFNVSASRQTFHCFGCGKGGNVFHFLMEMDRLPFPEAVRALAREAGIDIPETRRGPDGDEGSSDRDSVYSANRRAADFFARRLAADEGQTAREYIQNRGISDEMVERCCLGYAPDSWDALLTAARAAGVSANALEQAGLAIGRSDGSGHYDRFRNRLMFPIFDTRDRVVGFGARALAADDDVKYLNSPETPIFNKGRGVYGLNWARRSIVDHKRVAVVEGYTDVIMAHQHGCDNVVATLGTALTRDHIQLLRRFAERVDVVFDSDAAGQNAAERSMEIFLSEGVGEFVAAGFDVRIVTLASGMDPCELIQKDGPDVFRKYVDDAVDVFSHKIKIAESRYDLTTVDGKTKAVDEVLSLVVLIPNAVGRQLRVDAVVRRLSDEFGVDDSVIRARYTQIERRRRRRVRHDDAGPAVTTVSYDSTEHLVIEAALTRPGVVQRIFEDLEPGDFSHDALQRLFQEMKRLYGEDGTLNTSRLMAQLDDATQASLVTEVLNGPDRPGLEVAALDGICVLMRRRAGRCLSDIQQEMREAEASGDEGRWNELYIKSTELQREVQAL